MLSKNPALLIEDSRIDEAAHGGNSIGGDGGSESVRPDSLLVGRKVNAVDLVFRNITIEPLNLRSHLLQDLQRLKRDLPDLRLRERSRTRNFPFDHELRHGCSSL